MIDELLKETKKLGDPIRAKALQRFFKTGKGEYGEGDIFIGLTLPQIRTLSKKYKDLKSAEISKLLKSKIHEERVIAIVILTHNFEKGGEKTKEKIFNFYLKNTKGINNWDLVDISCHKIIGKYLLDKNINILEKLAKSDNLWERRIAIISTFAFININDAKPTLKIAEFLVNDKHDLIHKAVGWALREVGKRISEKVEKEFINKYAATMPRTMLRYAIERFSDAERKKYLQIKQRTIGSS